MTISVRPLFALVAAVLGCTAAQAGPVVCTTTLEAPVPAAAGQAPAGPVEVTRCNTVETVSELVERRFFSYTAPFARAVSVPNQIADLFGIAMGGVEGTRVMGLGFTDQTIIWDGTAIQNTTGFLLDQQHDPVPRRTADVSNGFPSSIGGGRQTRGGWQDGGAAGFTGAASGGGPVALPTTVRGLW